LPEGQSTATLTRVRYSPIVELRRYTLFPGKHDVLIDLFEARFLESQEDVGMPVLGTFTDLDDPSKFVWLRGFDSMESRARALTEFYYGPVWKAHRDAANATIADSDDVLLLRPAHEDGAFSLGPQPAPDEPAPVDGALIEAALLHLETAPDPDSIDEFERALRAGGAVVLGTFVTEASENDFPQLPVRADANVLACFVGRPDANADTAARDALERLAAAFPTPATAELLRLAPTRRSRLRVP
jgi:NIPSNAP